MSLLTAGCDSDLSRKNNGSSGKVIELSREEIKAGWGIPSCHLGMKWSEWEEVLGAPDEVRWEIGNDATDCTIDFSELGIMVVSKTDVIVQVCFWNESSGFSQFAGRLFPELMMESSMSEMISQFGEPSRIRKSQNMTMEEWKSSIPEPSDYDYSYEAGKLETELDYPKLGISFTFLDERIHVIRVYKPRNEF